MAENKTQNERLAVVETHITNIAHAVNRIEVMLENHIEKEDLLLPKDLADKIYARKEYEKKYDSLQANLTIITITAFGGLLGIIGFFIQQLFFK